MKPHHEQITAVSLYMRGEEVNEPTAVEIQHDPCCPGEVVIGAQVDSQRMDIADLYLDRDDALAVALAILASVAHIDHQGEFGEYDECCDDAEEQWTAAHVRAAQWVRDNPVRALGMEQVASPSDA